MNDDWNVETSNYLLGTLDEVVPQPKVDLLLRIIASTEKDIELHIAGTEELKGHFNNIYENFKFVKDTLVEVILSQKKSLEYNGFYNAFLMKQLSEKQFVKITKVFAYRPKTINNKLLCAKINILCNLTKIDYTPSELADTFQCNINDITRTIQLMTGNKSLELSQ